MPRCARFYQHEGKLFIVADGELFVHAMEDETAAPETDHEVAHQSDDSLCHCGRPKGHRGIHTGGKIKKKSPSKNRTMDEVRDEVQTMKANGSTSEEIADALGITLTMVNKFW